MRPRSALILVALGLLVLPGCPGESKLPPDAAPRGERALIDLPPPTEQRGPGKPDLPVNACAAFAKEGTSCAAQPCPTGLVAAVLDGKSCTCHAPCNPDQGKRCQPESCNRVCVQLTDSGKPLPGKGACLEDKGGGPGEPCPPACKLDLSCILHGQASFCRQSCTGPGDCIGYKLVCVPDGATGKICVPGGSTTGPKQGESCAAQEAYCVQGLLCDPQSKVCLRSCSPSAACLAPATCTKLVDPATSVVIGYGCK